MLSDCRLILEDIVKLVNDKCYVNNINFMSDWYVVINNIHRIIFNSAHIDVLYDYKSDWSQHPWHQKFELSNPNSLELIANVIISWIKNEKTEIG